MFVLWISSLNFFFLAVNPSANTNILPLGSREISVPVPPPQESGNPSPRRGTRKRVKLLVPTPPSRKKVKLSSGSVTVQSESSPVKGKGKASSSLGSRADEARETLVYPSILNVSSIPDPLPSSISTILRNCYSLTKNPDFASTGLSSRDWDELFSQFPACEQCTSSDHCTYSSSDFFCSPCCSKFLMSRKACSFKNIM